MAIAHVGDSVEAVTASGTTVSCGSTYTPAAGSTLIGFIATGAVTGTLTVGDSGVNTWQRLQNVLLSATGMCELWVAYNVANTAATFKFDSTTSTAINGIVMEFSGTVATAAGRCDRESKVESSLTTSHTANTYDGLNTPTDAVVVVGAKANGTLGTLTPGSGFTKVTTTGNTFVQWQIYSGAQTGLTGPWTSGTARTTATAMIGIRATIAAGNSPNVGIYNGGAM